MLFLNCVIGKVLAAMPLLLAHASDLLLLCHDGLIGHALVTLFLLHLEVPSLFLLGVLTQILPPDDQGVSGTLLWVFAQPGLDPPVHASQVGAALLFNPFLRVSTCGHTVSDRGRIPALLTH